MSTEHKVSFAKHPGAGVTAPVTPIAAPAPVASAEPAQTAAPAQVENSAPAGTPLAAPTAQNLPAVQDSSAPVPQGFYDGDEEIPETDGDVKTPWLSLIQPTTKEKRIGDVIQADGTYVLKKAVALDGAKGFRAVVLGFRPKFYLEKLEYIQNRGPNDPKPRRAASFEEIVALGGTDVWELSSQNVDKKTKIPKYNTPFFEAHIQALLAIECPAGVSDEQFPFVFEGKAFCPALFEAKGGSFRTFFVPINSERKGRYKQKWTSLYINISSRQNQTNPAYSAIARVGEATSPALQDFLAGLKS